MKKQKRLPLDEEIVLSCAFRYALGRMTYVVSSVCSQLQKNYYKLPDSTKERISKEIQEYQDEFGPAGMDFDNAAWNKIKWLFDLKRKTKIKANYYNTDRWEEVEAVKGDDGKYYSIPEMFEYHTVEVI